MIEVLILTMIAFVIIVFYLQWKDSSFNSLWMIFMIVSVSVIYALTLKGIEYSMLAFLILLVRPVWLLLKKR